MSLNIIVPEFGELGSEIRLARWLVREGQLVRAGEPVAEIEADKGILAIEAPAAGMLLRLAAEAGAELSPGAVLGVLGEPGEAPPGESGAALLADGSRAAEAQGARPPAASSGRALPAAPPPATPLPSAPLPAGPLPSAPLPAGNQAEAPGGRPRAAPAVRKLAASLGVEIGRIRGGGPGGLITREDVLAAARDGGQAQPGEGAARLAPSGSIPAGSLPYGKERRLARGRFVDLSHRLYPGREEYPLELETHDTTELYPQYEKDRDVWYILQTIHMSSHCGTHIEFPYHHNRNGLDAGGFPLQRLITPALLLDFRHKQAGEPVTRTELERFSGRILPGDAVLFHFGCDRFYRTERSHERPTLEHEAVRWLALEKKINLIGSDASGIELKGLPNQPNHQLLMDNQIPIIEFAANLGALRRERFLLFVLALPVTGLDSCPVRLVALEEE